MPNFVALYSCYAFHAIGFGTILWIVGLWMRGSILIFQLLIVNKEVGRKLYYLTGIPFTNKHYRSV